MRLDETPNCGSAPGNTWVRILMVQTITNAEIVAAKFPGGVLPEASVLRTMLRAAALVLNDLSITPVTIPD